MPALAASGRMAEFWLARLAVEECVTRAVCAALFRLIVAEAVGNAGSSLRLVVDLAAFGRMVRLWLARLAVEGSMTWAVFVGVHAILLGRRWPRRSETLGRHRGRWDSLGVGALGVNRRDVPLPEASPVRRGDLGGWLGVSHRPATGVGGICSAWACLV
nr:hypothetical protein GCM10020063_062060 [Dactylosporangium thailandense]